jgi:hypothetical protein
VRAVWKFPLALNPVAQLVSMPIGSRVIHVHEQNGRPALWAEVHPDQPSDSRLFRVFATGERIDDPAYCYVGTVHIDWTVWHVYEDVSL